MTRNKPFYIRYFWLLILVGILIRLVLAGTTSFTNDNEVWYRFILDLKQGIGPYGEYNFSYPPGLAAVLSLFSAPAVLLIPIHKLSTVVMSLYSPAYDSGLFSIHVTSPIFNYLQKLPIFIFEGTLLYLLYKYLIERYLPAVEAKKMVLLWWLNPLIIFITAVHGQLDMYPVLFVFVSVLLLKNKKFFLGGLILGLAVTLKLYPLFLLLPFWAIFFKDHDSGFSLKEKILTSFWYLGGVAIPMLLMLAYFIISPVSRALVFTRAYTIGFEGSLNLGFINFIPWMSGFVHKFGTTIARSENYLLVLSILLVTVAVWFVYRAASHSWHNYGYEMVTITVLFLVFIFSPRTNPQYLLWVFPSILILVAWEHIKLKFYWLISFAGLLFYWAIFCFSPGPFIYPFASFFGHIDITKLSHLYVTMNSVPGLINSNTRRDGMLLSGIIFIVSFVLIIRKFYFRAKEEIA